MDTFFEQILPIRKTGKTVAAVCGIWLLAGVLVTVFSIFIFSYFSSIALLLIAGVIFGAYKWSSRFNLEYEYILTNGTVDIDRIMSKKTRRRIISFELSNVTLLEKYNPNAKDTANYTAKVIACNADDPDAYKMVVAREGKGNALIVFAPDERMRSGMVKFLPRFIANSAFK